MTQWAERRSLRRAAVCAAVLVAFVAELAGTESVANAQPKGGKVLERFRDVPATFSGGEPEFTVLYDVQIIEQPNGQIVAVLDQQDSPDVLKGKINQSGVPPTLRNPGKELMTGGRARNGRTLAFNHYEYESAGQTSTWKSVVFTFPAGTLPFPAPEPPVTTDPEEDEEQETAGAAPAAREPADTGAATESGGGISPLVLVFVIVLAILLLLLLLYFMFRLASNEEEEGWGAWLWRKFKGLFKIGGRTTKGRAGSTVDMGTVEEAVDTVAEAVKDTGYKVGIVEKTWEYRLAMREEPQSDAEQAWRDRRQRDKAWDEWRGDGQPEDLKDATPEQVKEFEEANPNLPPEPPPPSYGESVLPQR